MKLPVNNTKSNSKPPTGCIFNLHLFSVQQLWKKNNNLFWKFSITSSMIQLPECKPTNPHNSSE